MDEAVVTSDHFSWIKTPQRVPVSVVDIGGAQYRLVDVSSTHPTLSGINSRLNGSTPRADALVRSSIARGMANNGIFQGAVVLREQSGKNQILDVQTTDPSESNRLAVFFTPPKRGDNTAFIITRARYQDSIKALRFLEGARYAASAKGMRL